MCGIAGVISSLTLQDDHRNILRHMTRRLIHRGPGSEGFFFLYMAMGMRRLSIIDLKNGD